MKADEKRINEEWTKKWLKDDLMNEWRIIKWMNEGWSNECMKDEQMNDHNYEEWMEGISL